MLLFDDLKPHHSSLSAPTAMTLSELNGMVREVIELSLTDEYWVTVELAGVRENRGHCYMELVEKDGHTNTPVAQARACCWRNAWMALEPKFVAATGERLRSGLKVLLRVKANFHEAFGFSWVVTDIDPSYTMGDMARRKQEIIRQLTEQGVIDMNKSLGIPQFAKRIAVVSSQTAAGYGDFCNQLAENEYGFVFTTRLFPTIMQGEQVEGSVIAALEAINRCADDFDVVVIIRGGGSTADLSGFDTLALAENVANFPLPIITGIGHERDQSVLDLIACVSQKTPTAVAAFLIDNLATTLSRLDDSAMRINRAMAARLQHENMKLARMEQFIASAFSLRKAREEQRLQSLANSINRAMTRRIMTGRNRLDSIAARLPLLATTLLQRERHRLEMLEQRVKAADPANILRLGYSITLLGDTAITDKKQLKSGDNITIKFASGSVNATVKWWKHSKSHYPPQKKSERQTMKEVNPKDTKRAYAFGMWMKAPMPMVTLLKTLDVSRLVRIGKKTGLKFNMLMCYCIGKAASTTEEFYLLPVGEKLIQYDSIAVNTIVMNKNGEVSSCDIPFCDSLMAFNADYLRLTKQVGESCESHDITESMVIGTSALARYEIDGAVGMYSGIFNNPFIIWGKYKRNWFKTTLAVSFQFHHTQMDGACAARFLGRLQDCINGLNA